MNIKELRKTLGVMSESEFQVFSSKLGGGYTDKETIVREFVWNPDIERQLCYILNMPTEAEKSTQAAVRSAQSAKESATASKSVSRSAEESASASKSVAQSAKWSAVASIISAAIALLSLVAMKFSDFF